MARSINEVAIAALARREHSRLEMRRKLKSKGFEASEIDTAIQQLCENNLLSDERFSESYINMRRQRGYGPLRIAQELRERGIDDELISAFVDTHDPAWRELMRRQYIKKYGQTRASEYAEKVKRARYLQTRGFPLDWIFKLDTLDDIEY
jgi:regulatory protein